MAGLVWTLLARPDFEQGLGDLGFSAVGILYVSLLAPHFVWLRNVGADGPRWVIFVLAIGMAGDTGGYFVGHALRAPQADAARQPGQDRRGRRSASSLASLRGGRRREADPRPRPHPATLDRGAACSPAVMAVSASSAISASRS